MKTLAQRPPAARCLALLLAFAAVVTAGRGLAAGPTPNFTGTWELAPARSTNLGMMSAMTMTLVIAQTLTELTIHETTVFQDQRSERVLRYDLAGKPVSNAAAMGGVNETVAAWQDGKLVVTWTGEGAIAGTKVVRTETRALAADGASMTVESVRGTSRPVVMVFERRK